MKSAARHRESQAEMPVRKTHAYKDTGIVTISNPPEEPMAPNKGFEPLKSEFRPLELTPSTSSQNTGRPPAMGWQNSPKSTRTDRQSLFDGLFKDNFS